MRKNDTSLSLFPLPLGEGQGEGATVLGTSHAYNTAGQLLASTEAVVSSASSAPLRETLYSYDALGEAVVSAQDIDLDGQIDFAGPDIVSSNATHYVQIGGAWWQESRQYAFPDGTIDRDEDGLTDLEEFQNQTDPRTVDTDGDGFSDAFEVANGMNPVSAEDFTPTEPDADNNGRIDLWENAPCYYGFTDADHDGFDDYYELEVLEPASDENFDVFVTVYTSRSAVLTWDNGINGIVVLPTTGQAIRLRLPFDADTALKLMPAPAGVSSPEAGGLWKAYLTLAFSPRSSQSAVGNVIIASNGDISQKVVDTEKTITRFPDEEESMQTLSLDVGDGTSKAPKIALVYRRLGIEPVYAAWHFVGEPIGTFAVTNYAGTMPESNSWSAEHGSVSPDVGMTTFLTVTSAPSEYESVAIIAVSELDANTVVTNRLPIPKCDRDEFGVDWGKDNFSPHLGETALFTLGLTGCPHDTREGWLEAEVMRETTAGWQHVGWLDMMPSESGHQKRRQCLEGPQIIVWDGIATEGAALAESPAVFTNGISPFHRALPQVVSGEPVLPPYYTIFFRYLEENSDSAEILDESWFNVYVPQVVKVEMTDEAYDEFKKPILYPETFYPHLLGKTNVVGCVTNVLLYAGCPDITKAQVLESVVGKCQSLVPADVNLKFTHFSVTGKCKLAKIIMIDEIDESVDSALGFTPTDHVSWPNSDPYGICYTFIDKLRKYPCEDKYRTDNDAFPVQAYDPSLFPFTPDELVNAIASVSTHETGHTVGLVERVLYGSVSKHNRTQLNNGWIMNNGMPFMQHFGKPTAVQKTWKQRNYEYLRFIHPKN